MNKCKFCNSDTEFIYNMSQYKIFQCKKCYTAFTLDMPSDEELKKFYSGFNFCVDKNRKHIFENENFGNWFKSFNLKENAKMLDIGGGGGFFSYAFNKFKIGESYYIDLDDEACDFANKELGIKNIINDDVKNLKNLTNQKFNFIYARHLIEHLKNPTEFIDECIKLLDTSGVCILQFPNALSYEYLGYPELLKRRAQIIYHSENNFSKLDTVFTLCSKKIAHGIDPIRHLWAITEEGISLYLRKKMVHFEIRTASLTHPVYSPYYQRKNIYDKIRSFIVNNTLVKIHGGTHLIVIIRRRANEKEY